MPGRQACLATAWCAVLAVSGVGAWAPPTASPIAPPHNARGPRGGPRGGPRAGRTSALFAGPTFTSLASAAPAPLPDAPSPTDEDVAERWRSAQNTADGFAASGSLRRARALYTPSAAALFSRGLETFSKTAPLFIAVASRYMTEQGNWSKVRPAVAPMLAKTLGGLGPLYVKAGQAVASRGDIFTEEIASALLSLQDAVPPFSSVAALGIIRRELQNATGALALLESLGSPVKAASVGQVYKGVWQGRPVAVKVRRPGVVQQVLADAALLRLLATVLAASRLVKADVVGAVDEFCSRLLEEVDFRREARNQIRFYSLYGPGGTHAANIPAPGIRIPVLVPELCTQRVLVMEWIQGTPLGDAEDLALVELGIAATLSQLMETGVMHADPHGGNLLRSGDQLAYLDFGLIADVPPTVRDGLVCAMPYLVRRDWAAVASLFEQLLLLPAHVVRDPVRLSEFTKDLESASGVLDFGSSEDGIPSVRFSALVEKLAAIAPKYEFQFPPYFLNNVRALACLEGLAKKANPKFNIIRPIYPFALRRLLANDGSPVLRATLVDLTHLHGRFAPRKAWQLICEAAKLSNSTRRRILYDALRTKGGRGFAWAVLRRNAAAAVATPARG